MAIDAVLLIGLTITALGAVMKRDTVKAAIALALSSIIVAILLFRWLSPLAAVFELSVCAGLITVIFMSTVTLTKPLTKPKEDERLHQRARLLTVLPVLVIAAGVLLAFDGIPMNFTLPPPIPSADVRNLMWNERQIDLVGQVLVILAGFFGVLVLFKERLRVRPKAKTQIHVPLPLPTVSVLEEQFENPKREHAEEEVPKEPVLR